jgi:hypothetical protein
MKLKLMLRSHRDIIDQLFIQKSFRLNITHLGNGPQAERALAVA